MLTSKLIFPGDVLYRNWRWDIEFSVKISVSENSWSYSQAKALEITSLGCIIEVDELRKKSVYFKQIMQFLNEG